MLADFFNAGEQIYSSEKVLEELLGQEWRRHGYEQEFSELSRQLRERYETRHLDHPSIYRVEDMTGFILYVWTRSRKPHVVLETGVANGHSSAILLNALHRNGRGELHSTDVIEGVGTLLDDRERRAWNYHLLPLTKSRRAFRELVERLGKIDLFFHDSQHTYGWQLFEFQSVFGRISQGGLLASDDIDTSFAFVDFCRLVGRVPLVMLDRRKLVGFVKG